MKSLIVLVDMDDTIEDLLGSWVKCLNEKYGTSVSPNDITDWDVSLFFPTLTREQVFAPLYDHEFWKTVSPIIGAPYFLEKLIADGHKVYIVTSSIYQTIQSKLEYVLFRYFPFINEKDVIITHHKQLIAGDVLVDDGVHNLEGGSYMKILMDAPHNRAYNAEENGMYRAMGWHEIYELISQKSESMSG